MPRILDVWFLNNKAGRLAEDDSGRLRFAYDAGYLTSADACPVSISMPLQAGEFGDRAARPYFSGLLPDELVRRRMARNLGVSEKNPFSLLEIVGGECAGALSLYPEGTSPHTENADDVHFLDDAQLDDIFDEIKRRPLLAGERGVRLSLAGVQDKIAVRVTEGRLALMTGGTATTHILKTPIVGHPGVQDSVHNELFCLHLAARSGLAAPKAEMRHTGKEPFLLIERYDRIWTGKKLERLHQEDFCQALSIQPENKYEREGGPNIAACLDVLQEHSVQPAPDRISFMNIVIFNYLIGNNDAHGKNFSLLHEKGKPRLAPAYDLLSTVVYPDLDTKMAMKIGAKYEPEDIALRDWHKLVPDTAMARKNLEKTLSHMSGIVLNEAEKLKADLKKDGITSPVFDAIITVIRKRGKNLTS